MDILDLCDDLITPVTDKFVLAAIKRSSKNKNSIIFVFDHPDDYDMTKKSYESVIWTYTKGAVLPPCQFALRDEENEFTGETANKTVNLGGVQFASLISALYKGGEEGEEDGELVDVVKSLMMMDASSIVDEVQTYIGLAVKTPFSGRVKGKDNVVRTQFKFPDWEYNQDPRDNTNCLDLQRQAFGMVEYDEQAAMSRESGRFRSTRQENAVTPEGSEEGDEILE
jgi:hypothetical protein